MHSPYNLPPISEYEYPLMSAEWLKLLTSDPVPLVKRSRKPQGLNTMVPLHKSRPPPYLMWAGPQGGMQNAMHLPSPNLQGPSFHLFRCFYFWYMPMAVSCTFILPTSLTYYASVSDFVLFEFILPNGFIQSFSHIVSSLIKIPYLKKILHQMLSGRKRFVSVRRAKSHSCCLIFYSLLTIHSIIKRLDQTGHAHTHHVI